jgi:hypothetical protein
VSVVEPSSLALCYGHLGKIMPDRQISLGEKSPQKGVINGRRDEG